MVRSSRIIVIITASWVVGCGSKAPLVEPSKDAATPDAGTAPPRDAGEATMARDAGFEAPRDAGPEPPRDAGARPRDAGFGDAGLAFRVVTFNTGTGANPPFNQTGYTDTESAIEDQHYGNGLAWPAAIEDARLFFDDVAADVVVFQEVFYSGDCPNIPVEFHTGFVCETWSMGDPTVAQTLLGPSWQVACHLGKPDKCAAVRRSFGTFAGCAQDLCLDGLDGARVEDCGGGSRVGRGVVEMTAGGRFTIVNVHGSSGLLRADQQCRERQFEQVFVDLGDGQPGANGARNLVMGDLNTDPGRNTRIDSSARRFNDFVGGGTAFEFISAVGDSAPPSYANLFNIDHVVSDVFVGECWIPGVTMGRPPVTDIVIFDHKPVVCDVRLP